MTARAVPVGVLVALLTVAGPAPAADTDPPETAVVEPPPRSLIRGTVDVDLAARDRPDGLGLRWLELQVGGVFGRTPWPQDRGRFPWNTRYLPDGEYEIVARAVDAAGNAASSAGVPVRVDNHGAQFTQLAAGAELALAARPAPADAAPPWTVMVRPLDGVVGGAAVAVEAFAVDDADGSGVASVDFLVDGAVVGAATRNGSRYTLSWDSTGVADGRRAIRARATDGDGKSFSSEAVTVVVDNAPPTLVPLSTQDVMVSPPNLNAGTVRVWVQFDPTGDGSAMDPATPPSVNVALPAGGNRNVGEILYLPERGLWVGEVDVAAGDGPGTAVISVEDAKDLGGNAMVAVARAGYVQLVAANPGPPVAGYDVMNNVGVGYDFGAPATFRVHEGVDYRQAAGTQVDAVRAGTVLPLHGAGTNRTVSVEVRVGTDAAGAAIHQFDVYLHVDGPVAAGTIVAVGDRVGDIGANYAPVFHHTHFYFGDMINASGYPRPRRNPLFLQAGLADQDPGGSQAALEEGGADGRVIYLLRRADATLLDTPADPVYGQVEIVGEYADNFGYYARSFPFSVGYRIRPTVSLGRAVRTAAAPYLASRWFEYDIPFDDTPAFDLYLTRDYSTSWVDAAGGAYRNTRYHHALVSRAAGTDGDNTTRAADQFWYTRAESGGVRDNGSDAGGAAILPDALFRDGRYRIELFGADLDVRVDPATGERSLYTMVGGQEVVVDNYPPYLEELIVAQGAGRKRVRYRARWTPGGGVVSLQPAAAADRHPGWINGGNDIEITAVYSEPLDTVGAAAPRLSAKRTDGSQRDLALAEAPLTVDRVWTTTLRKADADVRGHLLDRAAGRMVALAGRDLAARELDTEPATAAGIAEATGAMGGAYDQGGAADWGRVVDLQHALRIDTKNDEKPRLPARLEPGD